LPAYLFDLDGTVYQGDAAIPGAPALIARLRQENVPFRFVTNTTSKPRSAIVTRLRGYGFTLEENEVFTALRAGAALARQMGCDAIIPLVPPASLEDFDGLELIGGTSGSTSRGKTGCRAVVVGDLGALWSFALVQEAFEALMQGACFIALSRDRYWMSATGLTIDCGAFVAALEYASGVKSVLAGKPSSAFYHAAVRSLGLAQDSEVIMIGDDLASDVGGAQNAGYRGYLVQTGKFTPDTLAASSLTPDRILPSVVQLLDSSPPRPEP
jgi:HAD superfamily hydrolase (TIGR01458 family)